MLKFLKILLFLLVLVLLSAAVGLHVFINKEGKRLVEAKLEQTFKRKVTVGSAHTSFPFDLVVRNVVIKDVLTIDRAVARGGLFDIFSGNFVLDHLLISGATLNLVKHQEKPPAPAVSGEGAAVAVAPQTRETVVCPLVIPRILLRKVIITNSTLNLIDWGVTDAGLKVTVTNVDAQVENVNLPVTGSGVSTISLRGIIPWENMTEKGKVKLEGWVDLFKKDMRASLTLQDIDGLYFYPYFSGWIDAEKAKISKAKLNFESQMTGLNNDVTMDCHLELTDVQMKPRSEGESEDRAEKITNVVLGLLKSMNQGKIAIDFKVLTKMDSPKFGYGVIQSAFNSKIQECIKAEDLRPSLVKLPARIVSGVFKTAADLTRSVINGTVGIGEVIGKTLQASFSRGGSSGPAPVVSSSPAPAPAASASPAPEPSNSSAQPADAK